MATKAQTQTYAELLQSIKKRQFAPIYILSGEESFFIDRLAEAFEAVVPAEERDFNYYALYAPEITPETVVATCMRFPMMSDRQVVILKEAQAVRADIINKIHTYCKHPNPSTVLVICFRGDKAKGKDLIAGVKECGGVFFESKRLTDRSIGPAIEQIVRDHQLNIEAKAMSMLRDYIGLDMAKLYNEIEKLAFILGPGAMITPESIEQNIGISKDYNNYEFVDAIAGRDAPKAFRILKYFRSNPKNNPSILTAAALFGFFSSLLAMQFCRDKSRSSLMAAAGVKWDSHMARFDKGARNYNARMTIEIISAIREFDTKSKGVGSRMNDQDLLYDLVYKVLTCRGNIGI
ncbi:MAG: DNA polymerase III subunit delta [Bacteroides sp.]|nr:DNA polymerase III subunit delta [Bacteroides sp.]MCM1413457.1 DNA polymerase III subunit delta [Bacteroides sp.]MCM1471332.1 DNA polymerase III subunit delta [Bacteroides sp.]